jgi:hypothetical protein
MRLTKLLGALVLSTASSVLASAAMAQTDPVGFEAIPVDTVSEAFNRAFFTEYKDFYHNNTAIRQAAYILGPGLPGRAAFPELEIQRDAERVNAVFRDALDQQVSSDPVIRTPDLPNPFNTSVRLSTTSNRFGSRVEGGEFVFETVPPQ